MLTRASQLAALALAASACLGQVSFRSDVRLINVGFSVRDARGGLIDNLTQDDFEVVEDGVPQKIAFFARSLDVPLNLGLVVDISGSQGSFVKAHQHDLKAFLTEVLTKRDRAFLMCFAANPRLITEYTSSPKQLVDALVGFESTRHRMDYPILGPPEFRTGGTSFYDAIYHSVNQMFQNVDKGRKALIVFSDGEDNTSAHHMLETIEISQTNNVLLFCIRYTEPHNGRLTARNKYGTSVMARLAKETGGADFDAQARELKEDFREIGEQLRSSYELAYHSTNPADDGTFHKVQIRIKQPGLTVRAKTGYYAR